MIRFAIGLLFSAIGFAAGYALARYQASAEERELKRMLDAEDERAKTEREERALRRAQEKREAFRWN